MVRIPGGRAAFAIKALAGMQAVLNSSTILVIHHTGKSSTGLRRWLPSLANANIPCQTAACHMSLM